MSMDRDLHTAVPQTPDFCRDAVLQAAGMYREEKHMRKSYRLILVSALILALLCGTAYAVVNHYSVRDYVANGQTSAAFEETIVPLGQSAESHGVTMTLGDAVFDGKHLALAMNITAPENAEPLLIVPELTAWCGEEQLEADLTDFALRYPIDGREYNYNQYQEGVFVPPLDISAYEDEGVDRMALEACLSSAPEGEVSWRYTIHMFRPVGEFVKIFLVGEESETYALWMDSLRLLHSRGQIAVASGACRLDAYVRANAAEEGQPCHHFYEEDPLFEKVDAVTFEFTTPVVELPQLAVGESFTFDRMNVSVRSLTQSVMRVDFELEVLCDSKQLARALMYRNAKVCDQDGRELPVQRLTYTMEEDRGFSVSGYLIRVADEPITGLTFQFDVSTEPLWAFIPEFTVQLDQ